MKESNINTLLHSQDQSPVSRYAETRRERAWSMNAPDLESVCDFWCRLKKLWRRIFLHVHVCKVIKVTIGAVNYDSVQCKIRPKRLNSASFASNVNGMSESSGRLLFLSKGRVSVRLVFGSDCAKLSYYILLIFHTASWKYDRKWGQRSAAKGRGSEMYPELSCVWLLSSYVIVIF